VEGITKDPEQRRILRNVDTDVPAIHAELNHGNLGRKDRDRSGPNEKARAQAMEDFRSYVRRHLLGG
jgi:hypothetical protein